VPKADLAKIRLGVRKGYPMNARTFPAVARNTNQISLDTYSRNATTTSSISPPLAAAPHRGIWNLRQSNHSHTVWPI
jgi:hypothetical protein